MSEVIAGTVDTLGQVSLAAVYNSLNQDKGRILKTSIESVQRSYDSGMAAVIVDAYDRAQVRTAVGFVRFVPLIPHQVSDSLRRSGHRFQVVETGTAHIMPEHRGRVYQGHGHYRPLREALYSQVESGLHDRILVIGTTKNRRVIKSLHDLRERYPYLDYEVTSHDKYPGIKALTCVCTGKFGHGVQLGDKCSKRIRGREIIPLIQSTSIHHGQHDRQSDDIDCTMYVSSSRLADDINERLLGHFALYNHGRLHLGGYRILVEKLRSVGHYE
jgi:hypothetical protein